MRLAAVRRQGPPASWLSRRPSWRPCWLLLQNDYITVTGYRSMEAYAKTEMSMRAEAEKVWGKENLQSKMTQTDQASAMLGSEMYVVVDGIGDIQVGSADHLKLARRSSAGRLQ